MKKKYIYIGRFQLPHVGHEKVIENAIKNGDSLSLLIGSSNVEQDERNPFSFEERKEMMENVIARIKRETDRNIKIEIFPLPDFMDNEMWVKEVERLTLSEPDEKIYLTGCKKEGDVSTFYLDLFPSWKQDFIKEVSMPGIDVISSTKLRELFFNGKKMPNAISKEIAEYLQEYKKNLKKKVKKRLT